MKVQVQKSFQKDILKVNDRKLAIALNALIQKLENSASLFEIYHLKKMKSNGNYFRIRIGQ